jgi:hypothetical protein
MALEIQVLLGTGTKMWLYCFSGGDDDVNNVKFLRLDKFFINHTTEFIHMSP